MYIPVKVVTTLWEYSDALSTVQFN
jgi:hypothetical protein